MGGAVGGGVHSLQSTGQSASSPGVALQSSYLKNPQSAGSAQIVVVVVTVVIVVAVVVDVVVGGLHTPHVTGQMPRSCGSRHESGSLLKLSHPS